MKIEHVESLLVGRMHLVRVSTDTGLVGIGQSACWGYPEAVHAVVDEHFRPYLLGRDPLRIEHHWQHLYRMGPFRGSVLGGAVSAIDIALWDIKGKHLRVPIWELLGGLCRDRIRLCLLLDGEGPDDVIAEAVDAAGEGFTAVKFDPLVAGYENASTAKLVGDAVDYVAAMRDAIGTDVDIILELHRKLTPLQAFPLIDALRPFRALFVEDPIQIDSIQSQADIAKRIGSPMAIGERLHTIWEFRELLESGGAVVCRADLGLAGGFTHCKKIAAVAESFHAWLCPHNFLGPVVTAASVQLDAAIPNFIVQEFTRFDEDAAVTAAFRSDYQRNGGYIPLVDSPGLGVEVVDAARAKTPIRFPLGVRERRDGSLANSV